MLADPARGPREKITVIAFAASGNGYFLTVYPDRSISSVSFLDKILSMIHSLRWEESRTRQVETADALQLAHADTVTSDPALTVEGTASSVGDLYSGLVVLDTSLTVRPGLAERRDVSADGGTYTFPLRPQAKFHNGRPVLADGVLFSRLRAASPELNSKTALRYLGDIPGMRDYHEGKTDAVPGLRVVDSLTLQAALDAPQSYFLEKLTHPAAWIVDRNTLRLPNRQCNPNGTGPFQLTRYVPEKSLLMEPGEHYSDPRPGFGI